MRDRLFVAIAILTALALATGPAPVEAACGCEKPPPAAATVRPNFAYPAHDAYGACDLTKGACVALFDDGLIAGRQYEIAFDPAAGARRKVKAVAQLRRDLADGTWRVQLWAPVPPKTPLGPAAIAVYDGQSAVLSIPDTDFTVIAPPIVVPQDGGVVIVDKYRAAVGRDGTAYVALDVTGMLPRVDFAAKGYDLALRYAKDDMLLYNTQGVLMEALSSTVLDEDLNDDGDSTDEGEGDWNGNGLLDNPDISEVVPEFGSDTDTFFYSRHPFETYDVDHQPGGARALDPADPNWHVDGTRHTDNFHFVAAIANATLDGQPLQPGRTQPFSLVFDALVAAPAEPTP
jgi:hypothetical protein